MGDIVNIARLPTTLVNSHVEIKKDNIFFMSHHQVLWRWQRLLVWATCNPSFTPIATRNVTAYKTQPEWALNICTLHIRCKLGGESTQVQRPEKKAEEKKAQGKSLVSEHHEICLQENRQIHALEEEDHGRIGSQQQDYDYQSSQQEDYDYQSSQQEDSENQCSGLKWQHLMMWSLLPCWIPIDVLLLTYCSKDGMDMFTYEIPHESL